MAHCRLASAGDNIKFWDLREYSVVKQFNPHSGNVSSINWSQNNDFIVSASSIGDKIAVTYLNNPAYCYDLATEEEKTCLALNSASKFLLAGGTDGLIHIWELKSRKLKMTYKDHKSKVTSVQFNWNDTMIASGSESGKIILFSVINGIGYSPLIVPKAQAVRQVMYSQKKSMLGSVSDDGAFNLWDTSSKKLLHSFAGSHKAPATSLVFSPSNEMLAVSVGLDKRVICYDVVTKTPLKVMTADNPLTSIDMMSDGSTLAVGTTRGKICIYDLRLTGTPVKVLTAHKSSVQCLRFQKGSKVHQPEVGGVPQSTNSSQRHRDHSVMINTNAVNNNLLQRDITDGTAHRPAAGLDNQPQGSRTSLDGCVYSPLKDELFSPLSGNANLSRNSYEDTAVNSNGPSPAVLSRLSEAGFTEEEVKLYGTHDVTNSFCDINVKTEVVPTTQSQPGVSSSNISHEPDQTSTDFPVSSHSQFIHQASSQTKSPRLANSYNTDIPKVSIADSSNRGTEISTRKSSQVRYQPKEILKSVECTRPSPRLSVHEDVAMTTPPEAGPSSESTSGAVGSTTQPFYTQLIRNIVTDAMEEFRDQIRQDVLNLHTELIKQFFIQQMEIERLVKQHSINYELLAEIQRLQEENRQLKRKF